MDNYLSIYEFSKISGVESSKLRYWDEIGLFSPQIRNPDNNYRYYSLMQLLALHFVTVLSDLGLPLKTIAKLRNELEPDNLMELLDKQEQIMDMEMRSLRQRYSIIHARRELITFGRKIDETQILVQPKEEKNMIMWPPNEYREGDTFMEPLADFISRTKDYHINLSFPVGGYHENMDAFLKAPAHPACFFSIDPIGTHTQKAGNYMIGFARGYYGELGDMPERMVAYAKEHSLAFSGPVHTVYLLDEISTKEPSQYLAHSYVAVS